MRPLLARSLPVLVVAALLTAVCPEAQAQPNPPDGEGWVSLFDGESLDGWRASENEATFSVENGQIIASGPRAHLFYEGPVSDHTFENFEFRADVMTMPGSNSGIYFHTQYQEEGWPSAGCEAQINNTYESDPRKTGSLYAIDDVTTAPAGDNEWFTMGVRVQDDRVTITVEGDTVVDYTEPADTTGCVSSTGTFALQGHDPGSTVYFRNLYVRPLE